MLARLGYVMNWAANALALALGLGAIYGGLEATPDIRSILFFLLGGAAVLSYAIGRAARFVLAGE